MNSSGLKARRNATPALDWWRIYLNAYQPKKIDSKDLEGRTTCYTPVWGKVSHPLVERSSVQALANWTTLSYLFAKVLGAQYLVLCVEFAQGPSCAYMSSSMTIMYDRGRHLVVTWQYCRAFAHKGRMQQLADTDEDLITYHWAELTNRAWLWHMTSAVDITQPIWMGWPLDRHHNTTMCLLELGYADWPRLHFLRV